jgi:hypothetical protein
MWAQLRKGQPRKESIDHNEALAGIGAGGGNGGNGGNGSGGGVYVDADSTVIVSASDVTHNMAGGGNGADGGKDGQGVGGGVYNLGALLFDDATVIALNHASTSNDDGFGY